MSKNESNLLKEIIGPKGEEDDHFDEDGNYQAFGISRKAWGGEPMVDFITRDGNHQTFNYSHMYRVTFDPSKGLVIEFTNHVVTIAGQKLRDLHRHFSTHRVLFVREADNTTSRLQIDQAEPVVSKLVVQDRMPDAQLKPHLSAKENK